MVKFECLGEIPLYNSERLATRWVLVYMPVHSDNFFVNEAPMHTHQEPSPGDALKQWLELAGMSASAFSRLMACSVSLPGQWIRGDATPSYRMACRIEQMTDGMVPRTLWFPPGPQQETTDDIDNIEDLKL